jgi:5-methylcytosine-specific restriction endonuclease McrA
MKLETLPKTRWLERSGYRCWYCGAPIYTIEMSLDSSLKRAFRISWDHVVPRSQARGRHDNQRPACKPCNKAKAALSVEQYRALAERALITNNYRGRFPYIASGLVDRQWRLENGHLKFYFEVKGLG